MREQRAQLARAEAVALRRRPYVQLDDLEAVGEPGLRASLVAARTRTWSCHHWPGAEAYP